MKPDKIKKAILEYIRCSNSIRWLLLIMVTAVFVVTVYPKLIVPSHDYQLGDVADRDIKAPIDFLIENHEATQTERLKALNDMLTVYDHDTHLVQKQEKAVRRAFANLRSIIGVSQADKLRGHQMEGEAGDTSASKAALSEHDKAWAVKEDFEKTLGIPVSDGAYAMLVKERFAEKIEIPIVKILSGIQKSGIVANKEILLRESGKGVILRSVATKSEKVIYDLKIFYGLDQARSTVRSKAQPLLKNLDYPLRNLIVDLVQSLIHPNITLNRNETEERRVKAFESIKPVLYQIKSGEMLLREGERVTQLQLRKLTALAEYYEKKQVAEISVGAAAIVICFLMITYVLFFGHDADFGRDHNRNLAFVACLLITFFLVVRVFILSADALAPNLPFHISAVSLLYSIPLAAGAMTACLFLGLKTAIPVAIVLASCSAFAFKDRWDLFLYFVMNSTMAAYWIQNCRERKVFIKAGLKVGCLNVLLVTVIGVYAGKLTSIELVWDWLFGFLGGLGSGIVAAGIAPMMEITFDYTTDIKLLELANLDRPILRKLMIEAPGTYHHSVIVGSLVEAAASAIGANSLLAKVCGYYHDIGKIRKPLYFIENQTSGKNKHDKLAPSMSGLILIAHVKDGVEIAKENKLGHGIVETIRQHHGTSLISFFYDKAKQLKGEDAVNIDHYRYPGPKPQTREAGLVMLADVVEAASRTLENPTPSRIQGLVQHLINKMFSDGQLDECELTLKDLHNIAKSFNKILNGIHHHRIEYSDNLAIVNGKRKNGHSDRQPSKKASDQNKEGRAASPGHLKRLGLS